MAGGEGRGRGADIAALARDSVEYLRFAGRHRLIAGVPPATAPRPQEPVKKRVSASPPPPASAGPAADSLEKVAAEVTVCVKCPLNLSRTRAVPGEGSGRSRLMVVGEGPGSREDETGRPFVGEAGHLLTRMLEDPRSLGIPRGDIFITNIVKCRPPGNRDPLPEECDACRPYLERQMALVAPLAILSLGRVSAQKLLDSGEPISRLRGKVYRRGGLEVFPTFHPAYLLRTPQAKAQAWEDLKRLKARLEELRK